MHAHGDVDVRGISCEPGHVTVGRSADHEGRAFNPLLAGVAGNGWVSLRQSAPGAQTAEQPGRRHHGGCGRDGEVQEPRRHGGHRRGPSSVPQRGRAVASRSSAILARRMAPAASVEEVPKETSSERSPLRNARLDVIGIEATSSHGPSIVSAASGSPPGRTRPASPPTTRTASIVDCPYDHCGVSDRTLCPAV